MNIHLKEKCGLCLSHIWCGRQCKNAPKTTKPKRKTQRARSSAGSYLHNCGQCGKQFRGSYDKVYCSVACRVTAHRERKRKPFQPLSDWKDGRKEHVHISKRLLIGWSQLRFAVLERDGFKCRYCGRGASQGAILHADHIKPKSSGGEDSLENLVTACQECNIGKGNALIERHPT